MFEYLDLVHEAGPEKWRFDENKIMADTQFRFVQEGSSDDYVSELSSCMPFVSPSDILSENFLLTDWDPQLVQSVYQCVAWHLLWHTAH